ncbi:hypothetical protein M3Y97_01107200 [Aphelenchoides bicaudatus]|nr:hypothetical protein M3Y97_01107200 [Aphelenchoides bicaudatus]
MKSGTSGFLADEQFGRPSAPTELTKEQMRWLLEKVSQEDQKLLNDKMKACSSEMFWTKTLPFGVGTVTSVYFARKMFPNIKRIGPKNQLFVVGLTSLVLGGLLTFGTCVDRIKPLMAEMYPKYNQPTHESEYNKIRAVNRQKSHKSSEIAHMDMYSGDYGSAQMYSEDYGDTQLDSKGYESKRTNAYPGGYFK